MSKHVNDKAARVLVQLDALDDARDRLHIVRDVLESGNHRTFIRIDHENGLDTIKSECARQHLMEALHKALPSVVTEALGAIDAAEALVRKSSVDVFARVIGESVSPEGTTP